METDFNKRVRKVLVNTTLIASISIITYLLYSTIDKTRVIAEKDKKILIDSMTILVKVKELKALKTSYEKLELERDSMGLTNDSLISTVASLTEYIREAEQKDSVNETKMALFTIAIKSASQKLAKEKAELKHIESIPRHDVPATAVASSNKKVYALMPKDPYEHIEVHIEKMELEPINKSGKVLPKDQQSSKQIKHIRVKFNVMKSSLTKTIYKIFSVQLIEPDGNAYIFNPEYDYTFIDKNKIHMSNKNKVGLSGMEKQVSFLYPKATPFKPGQNIIQVFCDDKLLAEKEIIIK